MAPLFADFGEVLKAIIPILFLIIWVISQVVGEQGKRAKPGKDPKQQPQGRQPPPKKVAQEIQDFLKRAAQQQRGGGAPAERPRPQRPLEPATVDQVVAVLPSRDDIAESVESHLGANRLGRHAEQLGDEIREGDREAAERLRKRFDHQIGNLQAQSRASTPDSTPDSAPPKKGGLITEELVELFRNPRGVRNAVIVSEILNRPEHRW